MGQGSMGVTQETYQTSSQTSLVAQFRRLCHPVGGSLGAPESGSLRAPESGSRVKVSFSGALSDPMVL